MHAEIYSVHFYTWLVIRNLTLFDFSLLMVQNVYTGTGIHVYGSCLNDKTYFDAQCKAELTNNKAKTI